MREHQNMGKEYHRLHHQSLHLHSRTTFMPMLCTRTTIKDVALPKWKDHSSVSVSEDSLSPKIGCMGQARRSNKVIGFPTSQKITLTTNHNAKSNNNNDLSVKYSNLKKLFSSKNLDMMATTATVTAEAATASCGRRRQVTMNCVRGPKTNRGGEKCVPISIEDLDPPLPVIKKEQKPDGEVENLWKRRSGGVALKTLQLQKIYHRRHHLQSTSTTVCLETFNGR